MYGLDIIGILIAVVLFFIAVVIIRWIFGIGKIIDLLTVIAQELRANNAVENVDARLKGMGIEKSLSKLLNHLEPKEYIAKEQTQNASK
jgi:hypothetical protein